MKQPYILVIIILILNTSCNHWKSYRQESKEKTSSDLGTKYLALDFSKMKEVNVNRNDSLFILDSIISIPRIVKLETKNDCLIGNIYKLFFDDNLIFVVDKKISQSVFIFDQFGMFKSKISQRGNGPGEFTEIADICIDTFKNRVALLDLRGQKINFYSYDGEFVSSKKVPFNFWAFSYIDSATVAYYNGRASNGHIPSISNHLLTIASVSDQVLAKAFPLTQSQIDDRFTFSTQVPPLWKFDDQIFVNPRFSDTIYNVKKDTLIGAYYLNLNGKNIPSSERSGLDDTSFGRLTKEYSYVNGDFIELKDYMYTRLFTPSGARHIFYSKKTNKVLSGYNFRIANPLLSFFDVPVARFDENTIVVKGSAVNVLSYKKYLNDPFWLKEKLKAKELYKNLKEGDNPILLFYTIKGF